MAMRIKKERETGLIDLDVLEATATIDEFRDLMFRCFNDDCENYVSNFPLGENLMLWIWQEIRSDSRLREIMDKAARSILPAAISSPVQRWSQEFLKFVKEAQPALVGQTMADILCDKVQNKDLGFSDMTWLSVLGAYKHTPVRAVGAWGDLVGDDRYTFLAWTALSHDMNLGVWYLPKHIVTVGKHGKSLIETTERALSIIYGNGTSEALETLRRYEESSKTVHAIINSVSVYMGFPPPFMDAPVEEIKGKIWRILHE